MKIPIRIFGTLALVFMFLQQSLAQTPFEQKIFGYINEFRAENEFPPLAWDTCLYNACKHHSDYMKTFNHYTHEATKNVFRREHRQFVTPHDRVKFYCSDYRSTSAENLTMPSVFSEEDKTSDAYARRIVSGWIQSKNHRSNLLFEAGKLRAAVAITFSDCDFEKSGRPRCSGYTTFLVTD